LKVFPPRSCFSSREGREEVLADVHRSHTNLIPRDPSPCLVMLSYFMFR
jgi:hypothetical protein